MSKFLFFLLSVSIVAFFGYTYLQPTYNGSAPGCSAGGCHVHSSGIVSVEKLDSIRVQVTLTGVTAGKYVAGELVNSSGVVVDYINKTHSNPFILTATEPGHYIVNAGFKSPSKKWDSSSVDITSGRSGEPDAGWQSKLVITEIMFDVPKGDAGDANGDGIRGSHSDEFIEIYNTDSVLINLSGYQILDKVSVPVFTFPIGAAINPGQFAVVFGAVGTAGYGNNIPSGTALFAVNENDDNNDGFNNGQGRSNFSNAGDCVVLVNPANSDTLSEIYWGDATPVTSKPIYLGFPNTISGSPISGAVGQSVTHKLDSKLWGLHSNVAGDTNSFFSPGSDGLLVDVKEHNFAPIKFNLFQNYPNPFNPSTTISFTLPKSSAVSLKIFDILGHGIITLVDKKLSAGSHNYKFNAINLSSGIYIYELKTPDNFISKKMLLLK